MIIPTQIYAINGVDNTWYAFLDTTLYSTSLFCFDASNIIDYNNRITDKTYCSNPFKIQYRHLYWISIIVISLLILIYWYNSLNYKIQKKKYQIKTIKRNIKRQKYINRY